MSSCGNRNRLLDFDFSDIDVICLAEMGAEFLDCTESQDELADDGKSTVMVKEELTKISNRKMEPWKELCVICGDRASGFHYNAFSCEGCKGFFRRSITRNARYVCKFGGNCEMDMWMRRKCQACRLRRCREVGMKEECLLPENQCKERDARRRAKKRLHAVQAAAACSAAGPAVVLPKVELSSNAIAEENPLELLTLEEKQIIEQLVASQDQYEVPTEESIASVCLYSNLRVSESAWPAEAPNEIFQYMAEMTILVTHLVVEFAKHLPGFLNLDKDDQIVLLKGSASEVMMLRTARRYDPSTDAIIFADGTAFNCDILRSGGLQDYVDEMFDFARQMSRLAVDNAEYGLLTAISIFSDRPGLTNRKQVEKFQDTYVNTLQAYTRVRRKQNKNYLAKLLLKLVDLRTLSSSHFKILKELKVHKGSLPPLLSEYFDVFD